MSKFGSLLMMATMAENDAKLFDSGHHRGPVPYRSAQPKLVRKLSQLN